MIAQGSVNTTQSADTAGTAETYEAVPSDWPIVEGRLAMLLGPRGPGALPSEFGVSAHVGEMIYDFHANTAAPGATPTSPFDFTELGPHHTWSLNTDLRVPITHCFGVQGELFMGENLGDFFGGVGQSVDIVSYTDSSGVVHYPRATTSVRGAVGSTSGTTGPAVALAHRLLDRQSLLSGRDFRPRLQRLLLRQHQLRRDAEIPGGLRVHLVEDDLGRPV